ncbi:MAG: flavin reductase family protein [Armatimonadota bacterium]|nr:flavin reductase family protein [Armatimonadota bacterium]MDR7427573.1 flavin reductase family protein [Armatimonadota bacterium]MDR7465274.1 flavin reductase family protein [Armatimonadota bacterium]MDR7469770.1 flavin reductase family protein [Armatimonadota bacterium]MDR7474669.1 flavin reductase family protein [Armatimonadota bacterium]
MDAVAELSATAFRRVMGLFATGVTVLAVEIPDGVHGMTANAVASVSLDPILVLVCVDRRARTRQYLQTGRPFSINILRQEQEPLSRYFAGAWRYAGAPEFRFQRWAHGPLLVGALASVGCRVERLVEAGDHTIVLGAVTGLHQGEPGDPLLFFGGRYRRLMQAEAYVGAPADPWTHESARIHYDQS